MSILRAFNPLSLPESVQKEKPFAVQREIILQHLLNTVTFFGVLGLILFTIRTPSANWTLLHFIPFILLVGFQLVITGVRNLPYSLRAAALVIFVAAEGLFAVLQAGLNGPGYIYAVAFIAAFAVLFGPRAGAYSLACVILTYVLVSGLLVTGRILMPVNLPWIPATANPGPLSILIDSLLAVLLCAISILGSLRYLSLGLSSAVEGQKKLTQDLEKEKAQSEHRIEERTLELTRKASLMEAARQVSNVIAAATGTPHLLDTIAEEIKEKFEYYQVNIFLNDERNEFSTLRAATGEMGQKLLESNFRIKIGETGIVGYVAEKGKPRIARDVEGDPYYQANPALPETRAEFAVPLLVRGIIAGVLDIQSNQVNAFLVDDIDVITGMAEQISQALENTSQVNDLRRTLSELENTDLQNTRMAWNIHLRSSRRGYAFRYRQARIERSSSHSPELLQALKQGTTVVTSSPVSPQTTQPFSTLAIPIKVRNQTLGVINLRVAGGRVSPELVELVEGAVIRLSGSLENARLLEDIQARSEREQLVGDIASKVRSATDIDSILRTTAGELGRSLGVSEVVIQLNTLK